jgi:RIO kinase 1
LTSQPHQPTDQQNDPRPEPELDPPPSFAVQPFRFETYDDDVRLSNYADLEPLCRGPEPVPDWVVTDRAAVDSELGILKTGKEGDVFLLERAGRGGAGGGTAVMAAKRYRGEEHRNFHRSSAYVEGRRIRNSRDARAMAKKSSHGRAVAAGQWAGAEWDSLKRLWLLGVPVPYPVQIDGTEILMELVTDDAGDPAPRLVRERPGPALLASYFDQLRDAMLAMATARSCTATCRRTTCSPPATGWWSSTFRRWSTWSPTRPAPTSWCATATTCAPGSSRAGWTSTSTRCSPISSPLPGDARGGGSSW